MACPTWLSQTPEQLSCSPFDPAQAGGPTCRRRSPGASRVGQAIVSRGLSSLVAGAVADADEDRPQTTMACPTWLSQTPEQPSYSLQEPSSVAASNTSVVKALACQIRFSFFGQTCQLALVPGARDGPRRDRQFLRSIRPKPAAPLFVGARLVQRNARTTRSSAFR